MVIDVIIPAYNAHETIDRALASVAMQKLDPGDELHVTIVNDASPNGSYHECARYWAIQMPVGVVDKEINAGCGQARQTGIDVTRGEAICFLDADDVFGSPFALRIMLDGMKLGYDLVMGVFVEENADKRILEHGANYIWCHGKCYSRKFLEKHNLHFNETRGNEDVGFNSVLKNLTDNVLYVPQVMYIWENRSDSTVRADSKAYSYGHGWRDFIRNMSWTVDELQARDVEEEKILDFLGEVLGRMYWQYMDGHELYPQGAAETMAGLCEFYGKTVKQYAESGKLTDEILRAGYFKVAAETPMVSIPYMTFDKFLREIGFTGVN